MGQGLYKHKIGVESSHYKHGLCNHRLYGIWTNMKNRCSNPKSNRAYVYIDRGITVCDEWKNDFKAFYDWAMTNGYSDELTLDRIDNDKGYCPKNCRWTTYKIQNINKKDIKFIEFNGQKKLLSELAEEYNIKPKTLWMRLYFYKWPLEKALFTKVKRGDNHRT